MKSGPLSTHRSRTSAVKLKSMAIRQRFAIEVVHYIEGAKATTFRLHHKPHNTATPKASVTKPE